jgi:hypothetical protein
MKRAFILVGIAVLIGIALAVISVDATERAHNNYKTHRIDPNTVLFSCEDEHEPTVKKFENTTLVMISCEKK